ncbi:MAG: GYD domain-containing protein, partial [Nitrospiraceae bacterium]
LPIGPGIILQIVRICSIGMFRIGAPEAGRGTPGSHRRGFSAGAGLGEEGFYRAYAPYWTMGASDAVFIADAPDDEAITALALNLGSLGNVRTQTMRAYSADEMKKILAKLP